MEEFCRGGTPWLTTELESTRTMDPSLRSRMTCSGDRTPVLGQTTIVEELFLEDIALRRGTTFVGESLFIEELTSGRGLSFVEELRSFVAESPVVEEPVS